MCDEELTKRSCFGSHPLTAVCAGRIIDNALGNVLSSDMVPIHAEIEVAIILELTTDRTIAENHQHSIFGVDSEFR